MQNRKEPRITPFLAFFGDAEKAMKRYVGLIENSVIVSVAHYGPGDVGKEGTVKIAEFTLNGQRVMCNDIPGEHNWTFTPAVSLYVESSKEEALAKYFEACPKKAKFSCHSTSIHSARNSGGLKTSLECLGN